MKIDFADPQIWVAISFIFVLFNFWKNCYGKLSGFLDNKILRNKK